MFILKAKSLFLFMYFPLVSHAWSVHGNASNTRRTFLVEKLATLSTAAIGLLAAQPALASTSSLPADVNVGAIIKFGGEDIMSAKAHGTSATPVQENLRFGVSNKLADKICNYNRHFAENSGYFRETSFEETVRKANGAVTFYDSNTGKPLFVAPLGRSVDEFIEESKYHGWPSFRDQEVVWENVRVLRSSGETVSVDGTHLGRKFFVSCSFLFLMYGSSHTCTGCQTILSICAYIFCIMLTHKM